MQCLSCSKNLEGCEHRKIKSEVFCITCEVKFVKAQYYVESVFMIPKQWTEEEYYIKWDTLYHYPNPENKGEFKERDVRVISAAAAELHEPDNEVEIEDGEEHSSENFFDCEDSEQS